MVSPQNGDTRGGPPPLGDATADIRFNFPPDKDQKKVLPSKRVATGIALDGKLKAACSLLTRIHRKGWKCWAP